MKEKQYQWHKIAESEKELQFPDNNLVLIHCEGKHYVLGKHQNQLFAIAAKCPHAGGRMHEGYIDMMGNVVCPLHRYKFCMKTGRNVSGEGYFLKHWPVEVREDGIYMGIEEGGFFNWL